MKPERNSPKNWLHNSYWTWHEILSKQWLGRDYRWYDRFSILGIRIQHPRFYQEKPRTGVTGLIWSLHKCTLSTPGWRLHHCLNHRFVQKEFSRRFLLMDVLVEKERRIKKIKEKKEKKIKEKKNKRKKKKIRYT